MNSAVISQGEIGTIDTLLGLVAIASERVHEKTACEYMGFTAGELCDGIHQLSVDPRFEDQLKYLDFSRVGDSFYSKALEDFIFQAGVWGMIETFVWNCLYQQSVPAEQAKAIIGRLNGDYGSEIVKIIEEMADALIRTTSRYAR